MSYDNKYLQRLGDVLDYLIDPRIGVIPIVSDEPAEAGDPKFFHYYASACNTNAFTEQENFSHTGGASTIREIAIAKAVGEAVERYCSAIYNSGELPLFSYNSAPFRCVSPSEFSLYSINQYNETNFPYKPFTRDSLVRWVPAKNPLTNEEWYVPAAMVFVPYYYNMKFLEVPIVQPISTGLACHCSYNEAAISGVNEVIERDAFTIFWQAKLSCPRINLETLSDHNYNLVQRFEQTGTKVTILNITTDIGVPTILSVLTSKSTKLPALVFAAAASLDPEEAIRKSLEELAHTRRYSYLLKKFMPPIDVKPWEYDQIIDQNGHLGFWANHDNFSLASFVFSSKKIIEFKDIDNLATGDYQKDLKRLCSVIETINHKVLITDLTTPDIAELGLYVIHALVPGLHPLFMGYRLRSLGGKRIWSVPQSLGYSGITEDSGDNQLPHPYP